MNKGIDELAALSWMMAIPQKYAPTLIKIPKDVPEHTIEGLTIEIENYIFAWGAFYREAACGYNWRAAVLVLSGEIKRLEPVNKKGLYMRIKSWWERLKMWWMYRRMNDEQDIRPATDTL